ncbi:MAG: lysophospholipase [Aquiluna sp.]|jgi:acylglycerol lipase|nr:lysophospholipase [Aquiluna sp.]
MSKDAYPTWNLDLDVAAFCWPAQTPKANILLQHGLGEYTTRYVHQYSELIPKLNELGFNVYGFDLPGHGYTKGVRGLVNMHEALELHLKARAAIPAGLPLFLLGHSLGGLVTIGSIMKKQDGLAGAVISSSAMQKPSSIFERTLGAVMAKLKPEGPMPLPRPGTEALTRDLDLVKLIDADPLMDTGKAKNLVANTILEVSDQVWGWAANWNLPVLFIHGDKDTSTDHRNSQALFKAISASDKNLLIYPGGYHELLNDTIKDEVLPAVLGWFRTRI